MTKKVTEQVAQEKKQASLAMGHSPEKAERYAQEVRNYDRARRAERAQ